jgi:hypothetical protein
MTNYQTEHNILVVAIKYNPVISEKKTLKHTVYIFQVWKK